MTKEKEKPYKEREQEIQRGKRRYQERVAEEQEANKLIKDYKEKPQEEPEIDVSDISDPKVEE